MNGSDFRGNALAFREMGATKARWVLGLLEQYEVDTVVVSDTDVVWIQDPRSHFNRHPLVRPANNCGAMQVSLAP